MRTYVPQEMLAVWEVLTAIGTFSAVSAVIVAVALPYIHERLWGAKLELLYEDQEPFRRRGSPGPQGEWTDELWIRAKVENSGRSAASGVLVSIRCVGAVSGGDPSRGAVGTDFDPLRIWWSGRKDGEPISLARGESKLVDVLNLKQWHGQGGHMEFLTSEADPKEQPNDYLAGQYQIHVAVHAQNAKPMERGFRVVFCDVISETRVTLR
jgi:hypothetical protein